MTRNALRAFVLCAAAGLSAVGCESKAPPPTPTSAAQASTSTTVKLGAPIRTGQKVALTAIAKDTAKYANTAVTTEGRVTSVCQAMGCWMEITDTESSAH